MDCHYSRWCRKHISVTFNMILILCPNPGLILQVRGEDLHAVAVHAVTDLSLLPKDIMHDQIWQ